MGRRRERGAPCGDPGQGADSEDADCAGGAFCCSLEAPLWGRRARTRGPETLRAPSWRQARAL